MKELLRFTSRGTNGMNILYPPKFDFDFMNRSWKCIKKAN